MARRRSWLRFGARLACAALCVACTEYDAELLRRRSSAPSTRSPQDAAVAMDAAMPLRDARAGDGQAAAPPPDAGADASGPAIRDAWVADAADALDAAIPDAACDGDGDDDAGAAPGCLDECPGDPTKSAPGACGCGVPDLDGESFATCAVLRGALVHRYRFDGTGSVATDAKGAAHGEVRGATLAGDGALMLAGGTSDEYVDLPNGLISGLGDVTIEAWVTWAGGGAWQRIFDFGDSTDAVEGTQAMGRTQLFITPQAGGAYTNLLALFKTPAGEVIAEAAQPMPVNAMAHVAVVVDDAGDRMTLYLDGAPAASAVLTASLSEIHDINNWIGRSQWMVDPELGGVMHELRIYAAALDAVQLATSFSAGPDPEFLER